MIELIKRYWDIISGALASIGLAVIAEFELYSIQLYYSILLLMLVSIGIMRIIRQAFEKQRHKKERKHNIVDVVVDGHKSMKAISLAQSPTKEGEKIGEIILKLWEVTKNIMEKIKTFFSKFKGYLLTIALAILTVIEMYGGFINGLCGGALTVNGIEIMPLITLLLTAIVGILSNGYSKEQRDKIKALFSKSTTNEIVKGTIKSTIKDDSTKKAHLEKDLATKEHELACLNSELGTLVNAHEAKKKMCAMTPQLATSEDVQAAANDVAACKAKISEKESEIVELKKEIDGLATTIAALKSQL